MTSTIEREFTALLDAFDYENPVLDGVGEASIPGVREVCEKTAADITGVVSLAMMGAIGPEEFERGMVQYAGALVTAALRAGQALAADALDDVQNDLDALDSGLPWLE